MNKYDLPDNIDTNNPEFQNLYKIINNTSQSVFLTGKAGTGKSTFLKYICNTTKKKFVVLAPTGIAAVNVGGMTLHSFFKLPFKPLLHDDPEFSPKKLRETMKFTKEKVKLLQSVELIIIDEISMVRADIIDFIDKLLKFYNRDFRRPFGGKQLLLVGDIFQLGPVVTADIKEILRRYYSNFYFFNANIFNCIDLVSIELKKCYRQNNNEFIQLLDKIRVNQAGPTEFESLNKRYWPNFTPNKNDLVITLATKRDIVDYTNETRLNELEGEEYVFAGVIRDNFPEQNLPTSKELRLKVGAQVIFVRNDRDKRWVNGTLGRITELSEDEINVRLENGETYSLEKTMWENISYKLNEDKKQIEATILGTFTQYPIKPAWAITVHKSQGLTFNNVILDFGNDGAFTPGQTYVALSRCTSLEGIILKNQLHDKDVFTDREVIRFSYEFNNREKIEKALVIAQNDQNVKNALNALDNHDFECALNLFFEIQQTGITSFDGKAKRLIRYKLQQLSLASAKKDIEQHESEDRILLNEFAEEYLALGLNSLSIGNIELDINDFSEIPPVPNDTIAIRSAIANFNKAIRANPRCVDAIKAKIAVQIMNEEYDNALNEIERLSTLGVKDFWIILTLAKLRLLQDDFRSALDFTKKALKKYPAQPEVHDFAALLWDYAEEPDLSKSHKEKAKNLRTKRKKK